MTTPACGPDLSCASGNRLGIVSMVMAMVCFGINDALAKQISQQVPTFQLIFLRSFVVLGLMLGAMSFMGFSRHLRPLHQPAVLGRGLLDAAGTLCYLAGLFKVALSTATTITMSAPLFMTLAAALLFGERVLPRRWLCTALGFVGVVLVVQPNREGFNAYAGLCLLGTLLNVGRDLMTRRIHRDTHSVTLGAASCIALIALAGLLSLAEDWRALDVRAMAMLLGASVCLATAHVFLVQSLRHGELSVVAPFRYVSLPLALALGYLLWRDIPTPMAWAGMLLIVGSSLYVSRR
ncbi:MAG: DMT family transporter [Pseudomonadota bacterium]